MTWPWALVISTTVASLAAAFCSFCWAAKGEQRELEPDGQGWRTAIHTKEKRRG